MNADDIRNQPFFHKEHLKFLYLSHHGRINRKRYWLGALPLIVVYLIVESGVLPEGLGLLMVIAVIYPSFMLSIKRAHDRNRSGHFCWLLLVPVISLWPSIELSFVKGSEGDNRFGGDLLS